MINKNRNRNKYTFANINLLGKCNANCYFCLGKDIPQLLNKHNQLHTHFKYWKNFDKFLEKCNENNIQKLYITGQNTDSLCYDYFKELVIYLKEKGFKVGIRTNGYNIENKLDGILELNDEIGLSIHTLNPKTNKIIMGREDLLDLNYLLPKIKTPNNTIRVAIVLNRYNKDELKDILYYLSKFKDIEYIQVRRISTDTREDCLLEDIKIYEEKYQEILNEYKNYENFYNAQIFTIFGKKVCFWRTVETSANSINYFTDGTISDNYFVVEGYLNNYDKYEYNINMSKSVKYDT